MSRIEVLKDRRVMVFGGAAGALLVALGVVVWLAARADDADPAPPGSGAGLMVHVGRHADPRLDPALPLRCFVGGLPAGEMTVAQCAARNGVAAGALDVGIDQSGALAAASGPTTAVTPLPPADSPRDLESPGVVAVAEAPSLQQRAQAGVHGCWRNEAGDWQASSVPLSLGDCVRQLFAGQCATPGDALYGRWGGRTLRLAPGRVEISSDGVSFHTLMSRKDDCAAQDSN